MTQEKFRGLINYLYSNYNELYLKFKNSFVADENGFGIFKPAKVSDEDYEKIKAITDKWREKNELDWCNEENT